MDNQCCPLDPSEFSPDDLKSLGVLCVFAVAGLAACLLAPGVGVGFGRGLEGGFIFLPLCGFPK